MQDNRVLSGMRPTGRLHLGHYHGVLKNWLDLQNEYDLYFFVADWHAFTTHYSDKIDLETNVMEMVGTANITGMLSTTADNIPTKILALVVPSKFLLVVWVKIRLPM